mgnify:CR=1 FL=1
MNAEVVQERAEAVVRERDPAAKCAAARALHAGVGRDAIPLRHPRAPQRLEIPGRPERPELVPPRDLARRGLGTEAGRAALLHALAHIEFNAINLAVDAVYRFPDMARDFYLDWARVGADEARHFTMLRGLLNDRGYDYGDFPAHNGLWETAVKTDHDLLLRMALVPRVLEARGIDVTPGLMQSLSGVGAQDAVEALDVIYHDEIEHVHIGNRWFHAACGWANREPRATFNALIREYMSGRIKGPFDREGRLHAGFSEAELDDLEALAAEGV